MNRHASSNDRNASRRTVGREPPPRSQDRGDNDDYTREDDVDDRGENGRHRTEPPPRRRLSGSAAADYAKAHILDLTGHPCEEVSSLCRTHDGWRVVLEVVELERIPRTTDILASFQVELDDEGELMAYQRIHRYCRNEVDGE